MKKLLNLLAVVVALMLAVPVEAGVVKFASKHVVKPVAHGGAKVAKAAGHGVAKAARGTKKVLW